MRTVLKRIHISPYGLCAIALIAIAAIVRLILIAQGWPETNSDEGTMGLEAMHIAFRGEHPIFLYGQNYMGMVEAYLGAALFRLFGISLFNLRLGMILLFTLFLIAMYILTSMLYSKKLALLTLALLCVGTRMVFMTELLTVGGAVETLLFGTLLMLLASWLALTFTSDNTTHTQRRRYFFYGCWGFAGGIGLYSHMLILPFLATSILILLVFCHKELRHWPLLWLVIGFLIGATPLIIYNVTAPFDQNSLAVLLELHRVDATNAGAPQGMLLLVKQFLGTFLYSLPVATNLSPVCALSDLPLFGPTTATTTTTVTCTIVQGGWSLGYIALLFMALFLAARPLWTRWKEWIAQRSEGITPVSPSIEERKHTVLEFARLMLLLSAALTIFLYVTSPTAAVRPWSTRYLVGLLIALPAVLWPLWQGFRMIGRKTTILPLKEDYGRPQGMPSQAALEEDERTQGIQPPVETETDGRSQETRLPVVMETNGRPQQTQPSVRMDTDGRPQGAPPIHPTTPVPTMLQGDSHADIVGTGVVEVRGGAPCGRPSSHDLVDEPLHGRPSSPSADDRTLHGRPFPVSRFALAFRSSIIVLIGVIFLIGTINIFTLVPGVQALNQQDTIVIHDLSQAGITHMYSDYWTCDRLIFLSQEHLICGVVNDATTGPELNRYAAYYTIVKNDPHSAYVFVANSSYAYAFAQRIARTHAEYRELLFDGYVVYVPIST